jgi:hypothetical protein
MTIGSPSTDNSEDEWFAVIRISDVTKYKSGLAYVAVGKRLHDEEMWRCKFPLSMEALL